MWNKKKPILDYALNYIFKYQKTEKELITQLRKKWYNEKDISKTLDYLKEKKYVNDLNYIKDYTDYHLARRWRPISYVKSRLIQKWLKSKDISEVISENIDEINNAIWDQLKKEIEKYKERQINPIDIIQKLNRKWYTLNQIRKVLDS